MKYLLIIILSIFQVQIAFAGVCEVTFKIKNNDTYKLGSHNGKKYYFTEVGSSKKIPPYSAKLSIALDKNSRVKLVNLPYAKLRVQAGSDKNIYHKAGKPASGKQSKPWGAKTYKTKLKVFGNCSAKRIIEFKITTSFHSMGTPGGMGPKKTHTVTTRAHRLAGQVYNVYYKGNAVSVFPQK